MLNSVILSLVISYVVSQLQIFGVNINWTNIKATVNAHLQALIPFKWLEGQFEKVADTFVDALANVLKDPADVKQLVEDLANKDFADALVVVKTLVANAYKPSTPEGQALLAVLMAEPGTDAAPAAAA